jgi:hypothetical protein
MYINLNYSKSFAINITLCGGSRWKGELELFHRCSVKANHFHREELE